MCTQYPQIIITSPTEPADFCYVPQTIQENLLTTNYEQWCALYSMNDDDISLAYVSSNLQRQKEQQIKEEEYQYGEEYIYEYDDFEDDDFFDKYNDGSRRQTLDDEFNAYNEIHSQKYECYDNKEYEYYNDFDNNEEGFDYEYEYEYDDYNNEEMYYIEKEPCRPISNNRPRLNYDILASAISRRFNNATDSDESEEEDIVVDEFDNEVFDSKIIVKSNSSKKSYSNSNCDLFQEEDYNNYKEDDEMYNFMETIQSKYSNQEISSLQPTKPKFTFVNDMFNNGSFGTPEAISNKYCSRKSFSTHRKTSSLQWNLFNKTLNNNSFSSIIGNDCGVILNGPMKNRKRAFSLNERNLR